MGLRSDADGGQGLGQSPDQEPHSPRESAKPTAKFLKVVIQPWLALKLRIAAGSLVIVDNVNGKFTITRSPANDEPTH
jgi:hypothetical protein